MNEYQLFFKELLKINLNKYKIKNGARNTAIAPYPNARVMGQNLEVPYPFHIQF